MSLTVKTPLWPVAFLFCLMLLCAGHVPPASAAEVEWSGDISLINQIPRGSSTIPALAPPDDSPSNNTVRVENTTPIEGSVLGGYDNHTDATDAESSGNSVIIGTDTAINNISSTERTAVYGGLAYSQNGQAESAGNTVTINGGYVQGYIYGGYANSPTNATRAMRNMVVIGEGTIAGNEVYGGYALTTGGTAIASDNIVRVDGGHLESRVYGGRAFTNSTLSTALIQTENNTLFINDGVVESEVYGGNAFAYGHARSVNDSVFITGGTINWNVYGAFAQGDNVRAEAEGNSVTITGGTVTGLVHGGYANTVHGSALAQGNWISMSGGTINNSLSGGTAEKATNSVWETTETLATENTASVSGGTVTGNVIGGYAFRYYSGADNTGTITATNNSVVISDGTIGGYVAGGLSSGTNYGANAPGFTTNIATGNSVYISGGTIEGNVYGGYTQNIASGGLLPSSATATNNSVTLTGSPSFGTDTQLYGGYGTNADESDFYTGNTLNVLDYYESTPVEGVANFQNYNFLVPSSLPSGSAYLQTGSLDLGDSPQLLGVGFTTGQVLPDGYSVDLIRSDSEVQGGNITETRLIRQGVIMEYDGVVTTTDHALNLTLRNARVSEGTKSISEGRAGSLALTAQGADFVAFSGIAAANAALSGIDGYATFSSVKAGDYRYNTGSHVDVKGVSMLAGVAGKVKVPGGTFVIGPAFEAAYADFDAGGSGPANGGGYGRSFGGALLGRYQHDSGAYLDASLRAGVSQLDYRSSLRDDYGRSVSYDARVPYYGLHVSPGWQWSLTEKATLDISAAYLWTHMEGSKETLSSGDKVRFESADSHRLRAGARVGYEVAENLAPYIGAAYEYEMDGKARAGAYGYDFKTPSLKGGSGIGEVGISWNAAPLYLDLGLQGYTGKREGFGGSLMIRFEF